MRRRIIIIEVKNLIDLIYGPYSSGRKSNKIFKDYKSVLQTNYQFFELNLLLRFLGRLI